MSADGQLFSASLAKGAVYNTGLRSFMDYLDLGIDRATHGRFRAHVIRIKSDAAEPHDLHTTGSCSRPGSCTTSSSARTTSRSSRSTRPPCTTP